MGSGIIRFQVDRFLVLADRLIQLAFPHEGKAEIVVGRGVIRFQADGFLVFAHCLVNLAGPGKDVAEAVVRLGVIRFQAEGFLVLADRLIGLALPGECNAEVGVRYGIIRFQAEGFLVLADRFVGLALLVEILCSTLSGGKFLTQVGGPAKPEPTGVSHFFLAINIEAFRPLIDFKKQMDEMIGLLKSSPLAIGREEILVAGEKEFAYSEFNEDHGVPLIRPIVEELKSEGNKIGVPFDIHPVMEE